MTIDSVPIRALRVVLTVAERGSFAAAGRTLDLPRAAVSRIVGQLEDRVGTRLFRRNTRKVVPTDAGAVLIEAARRSVAEIDAALVAAEKNDGQLSGPVRVSVSHAFGRHFVLPSIGRFRAQHPTVQMEIHLEDRLDDIVAEEIDLTVRLGPLSENDMFVRRVGAIHAGLFAAPFFLEGLKEPITRETLANIPAIGFRVPGTGQIMSWPAKNERAVTEAVVPRTAVSLSSIEAVADLVREGVGASLLPRYLVADDLANQRLKELLPEIVSLSADVHICFREKRLMPRRVRAFIDHLAHDIAEALRTQ